jgi:deoxyribonuclease-4
VTRFFGSHTVDAGGIHMAARRAGRAGMSALQIFTAPGKYYNEKMSMKPERIARFREALDAAGIAPANVLVHAAYVLNLATPDAAQWGRASAGLTKELERSTALGAGAVCFHPGAATDGDRAAGIARIGRAISTALERIPGETRLLIENTAGAGNTMARTEEEIAAMLALVPPGLRDRTGYGLDTCHLFASGYELAASPERLTSVLDGFERVVGEPPRFFHLNDSLGALGSNRDRHALIGQGLIGVEPFRWLLADRRTVGVPLILETPPRRPEVPDDDDSPDPDDVAMRELLAGLAP